MKFHPFNLAQILTKIKSGELKALLIYGPNRGFINVLLDKIKHEVKFIPNMVSYKEINAHYLNMMANNQNFFGDRELIKIIDVPATIDKDMKETLSQGNFFNFICFIADDSLPASGIRKFFEEHSNLGALGCYFEDQTSIVKMILQRCTNVNKNIDEDALSYLKLNLKGDFKLIENELDKLFAYSADIRNISLPIVQNILSHDISASGDEMCIYFAKKEAALFLREIDKLKEQNINEILILRTLIRYYMNLYIIISKTQQGENLDFALKSLSPPIFYKYIPDFKQNIKQYSISDIIKIIEILGEAEVSFKTNAKSFNFFNQIYLKAHHNHL